MNTEQRTDTGLVLRIDSPVIDAIYEIFGAGARWIRGNHIDMGCVDCSECGKARHGGSQFCPACGTKMEGEDE